MAVMRAGGGAGRCKQEKEMARCVKANSGDIEGGAGGTYLWVPMPGSEPGHTPQRSEDMWCHRLAVCCCGRLLRGVQAALTWT